MAPRIIGLGTNDVQPAQTADAGQQATQGMSQQGTSSRGTAMPVSKLLHMDLYNVNGSMLGDIEHVVTNANGGNSVVIGHGGLLGLGA